MNEHVGDEDEIVWLQDPGKFRYLRETTYMTTRRRGRVPVPKGCTLVGYATHRKTPGGITAYIRRFWWLKPWDRDLDPEGCYDVMTFKRGPAPVEAVVPASIEVGKKSTWYSSSDLWAEDIDIRTKGEAGH
jgi:hypothetical protein